MARPKKQVEVAQGAQGGSNQDAVSISKLLDESKQPVDLVDRVDLTTDAVEMEAFMNQMLTIYVPPSDNPDTNPVDLPSVNGVNQPVPLGQTLKVRRKIVEVMARSHSITYQQITPNLMEPEKKKMIPRKVLSRPFTVTYDPAGEDGIKWLQAILDQG